MYLEPIRAVGLPAGYYMQYSPTGLSRMYKIPKPKKRSALTAEQIIAQNAFLAKVAASKPKRRGLPPMAVNFR